METMSKELNFTRHLVRENEQHTIRLNEELENVNIRRCFFFSLFFPLENI